METLRHRLRQLRKKRGWTLKETEEKSSVPLSYLSAIENGRRRAGSETLAKLAEAYSETPEEAEKLLEEFERCRRPHKGFHIISSEVGSVIGGQFVPHDEYHVSSFDMVQELEQLLLVLGGCDPCPLTHHVVRKTDREISDEGKTMSRGYVIEHDNSEFLVEISVSRKAAS